MAKELQNRAWSCLPKEFKEEVKKLYTDALDASNSPHEPDDRKWGNYRVTLLEKLFGIHNLTSDAEGEEMLMCEKSKVMKLYNKFQKDGTFTCLYAAGVLDTLFDSKCLPDETQNLSNLDKIGKDCNVDSSGPKPAEPKFKVGDKVKDISSPHDGGVYTVDDIKKSSDGFIYHIQGLIGKSNVKESDLEHYTEPLSQNPHENCDNGNRISNFDHIADDRKMVPSRLQIAAMAMQGILSNPSPQMVDMPIDRVAQLADAMASILIAESEKGVHYGED